VKHSEVPSLPATIYSQVLAIHSENPQSKAAKEINCALKEEF